jgi:peroxiredoxin
MKKLLFFLIILIVSISCSNDNRAKLNIKVNGINDGDLVLTRLDINRQTVVDSLKLCKSGCTYFVDKSDQSPEFYYINYRNNRLASLILMGGDRVSVSTDTLGNDLIIEGSDESKSLVTLEKTMRGYQKSFDSLMVEMDSAVNSSNLSLSEQINYQLGSIYVKSKQRAIKHIYENPYSIANLYLIYYKFNQELPLFGDVKDMLILKRLHDSLSIKYPKLKYLTPLSQDIQLREQANLLSDKLSDADETGFPDITLPNIKSEPVTLSDFKGNVILLVFWSVSDVNQLMMNKDLMELYLKHKNRGFEIYQVSVDTDKSAWARAIRDQNLPWINVCDGKGANSYSTVIYNISKVPSTFLIDKEGTIVERDIFGNTLERRVESLLAK